uniref:B box-type domain-containing protein n=1 Tax=Branchiostoma floridae TaxID=7739 RepID=C3YWZ9_BRAFL|eukprot:XP_002599381.1 hypothetical protein BRAFLDRAFT_64261 [Branchiostoma floridae]
MASELELLKSNRGKLVETILNVKPFLDRLLQHGEIVKDEYDTVVAEKTPQDKARALLDLVAAKGRGAFIHFRQHLKKDYPEVEEVLHRCAAHNLRYKLYCEQCGMLLCRDCRTEDHKDHSISSIVADADVIRRDVTAFMRDNRKLLKKFKTSDEEEGRQKLLFDIEMRKNALKAMFIAKIEREFEWCRNQLGASKVDMSEVASISSIASTESNLSSSDGPDIEPAQSRKAKTWRRRRPHPYLRENQKDLGTQLTASRSPSPEGFHPPPPVVPVPPSYRSVDVVTVIDRRRASNGCVVS